MKILKKMIFLGTLFSLSLNVFAYTQPILKYFLKLADNYIDEFYFPNNPTAASQLGLHSYDDKIEDYSKTTIDQQIVNLKQLEKKFMTFPANKLNQWYRGDYFMILNNIRSQLLTLQEIKPWQKNPNFYASNIMNSAFVILQRDYAPLKIRLQNLIAREKYMPKMLNDAKTNLKNPPKIFTELALEQLPDIIKFYEVTLPITFGKIADKRLLTEFDQSNRKVIRALRSYQDWLAKHELALSIGDFRIGKTIYQKKLLYDEMIETPLQELLQINIANMHSNQIALAEIARKIDKHLSPQAVLDKVNKQYVVSSAKPENYLLKFQTQFAQLIQFIKFKKILTLPNGPEPEMQSTPAFMRATTTAAMDAPGPYEKATQAYFYVTLPDNKWNQKQIADFVKSFSSYKITLTSIHETYPGHYVQFLFSNKLSDRIRQIFISNTNNEGWAHYCEQMMLDEGYVENQQNKDILRLNQLNKALLRNGRFMVGIKLHTGEMTFEQAVNFFIKEAYQSKTIALLETKRATEDPLYLYYTLGKLQILKLRTDLMKKQANNFSLQKFHDAFLQQGLPPIKIIRQAMLQDDV